MPYSTSWASIPSSRRRDLPDILFRDRGSRLRAVVDDAAAAHAVGRPVLIGTATVRDSEELAATFRAAGIGCALLNAKNDEEEAALIAGAGRLGAVTISTNMAGRGTDIKLGLEPEIRESGGLYVIGTDKSESRRVDDQLRGRAGRQGDPGECCFFLSLEDPLFERYGVEAFLPRRFRRGTAESGAPQAPGPVGDAIVDRACLRELERAQRIIEGQNAQIRDSLLRRSLIVEFDRRYLRELREAALLHGRLPRTIEEAIGERLAMAGEEKLQAPARAELCRLFIARLDAAWAEQLELVEDVKEGLALQRYGGLDPSREYLRMVSAAFEETLCKLDASVLRDFELLRAGDAGAPAKAAAGGRPEHPSSTWTYAVDDEALPGFDLGVDSIAAFALGPLALPLFLARAIARRFGHGESRPGAD